MDDYEDREQDRHDRRMARLAHEKDVHNSLLAACKLAVEWLCMSDRSALSSANLCETLESAISKAEGKTS